MNRPSAQIAAALTVVGLIADLSYFAIHAATRFLLDGMWFEGVVFIAVGGVAVSSFSTVGLNRIHVLLANERRTITDRGE